MRPRQRPQSASHLLLSALLAASLLGCSTPAPFESAGPRGADTGQSHSGAVGEVIVGTRRVTESQYRHTIADVFGPDIKVSGRFEPDRRDAGLQAVGTVALSISSAGFEQYYAIAQSVADQVFDPKRRAARFDPAPVAGNGPDDAATARFVTHYGERLFRRPLSKSEVSTRVALARQIATSQKSFEAGLKVALVSLLTAPEYLFRVETAERDASGGLRLDGYAKAQRLSYLLWDTSPDEALLKAAASGELHTETGLADQVSRLMADHVRVEQGTRALFSDILQFERFDTLTKDPTLFPKFNATVAGAAKEQTLRTIVDLLLTQERDYRDLFTSRETFIDRSLASVYQVPFRGAARWEKYVFPEGSDRQGLLTQVTFLSLFSHPGRSSPTVRGVGANEVFLCISTPPPPPSVDFSIINDTKNVLLKTSRARLLAHATDETCASCHNRSDPIGLSLERFDSLGQTRTKENGELIDVSAEYGGVHWEGASGLAMMLHDNPLVTQCAARNVFAYGVGREPQGPDDKAFLARLNAAFAASGFKYPALIKTVALSPDFFRIAEPAGPKSPETARVAQLKPSQTVGESAK